MPDNGTIALLVGLIVYVIYSMGVIVAEYANGQSARPRPGRNRYDGTRQPANAPMRPRPGNGRG